MSFKLLKFVVEHLRKTEKCPFCKSALSEDFIFVLATGMAFVDAAICTNGIFYVVCEKCTAQAFVMAEVMSMTDIRVHRKIAGQHISTNEILDMHNFLKHWQGDVKELFNEI